jgi:glycosyltransferase involved in cell wall biosynthesis
LGFLSSSNYFDPLSFSGTLYSMHQSLSRHAHVVPLGHPYLPSRYRDWLRRLKGLGPQQRRDKRGTLLLLDRFRRIVEKQLKVQPVDLLFAPVASAELSVVDAKPPALYASDATFKLLHQTYGITPSTEWVAFREDCERVAIEKSAGLSYSSTWAAESATRDYGAPQEKIRVIPYGANVNEVPDIDELRKRQFQPPWKLVFIGVNWHRKGGDIALRAFEALRGRGVEVELTVIGSEPPGEDNELPVRIIRNLDKRRSRDRTLFREILLASHAMLFPSRGDCSPIALCEAAAYGIPVVAADVGGISSIITEHTGRLMPTGSTPEDYATAVMDLIGDPQRYRNLVLSSRQRYDEVLNWDKWAQSLLAFSEQFV